MASTTSCLLTNVTVIDFVTILTTIEDCPGRITFAIPDDIVTRFIRTDSVTDVSKKSHRQAITAFLLTV